MRWNGHKLSVVLSVLILMCLSCNSDQPVEYRKFEAINIIPMPQHMESMLEDCIRIDSKTTIAYTKHFKNEAEYLKQIIDKASTFSVEIKEVELLNDKRSLKHTILLATYPKIVEPEGYMIVPGDEDGVSIMANHPSGMMHGIQTLRQLFVHAFSSGKKRDVWGLPYVVIEDAPKFKHRGLLLDCSRHFFSKAVVKKYIDLLALYKMNVLHWHLTEDQGWRIAIDAYPKLTEIGAWRTESDGAEYGGFYTKADIREIVKYAKERHVTIIPEIELPGHSQAAISAYPQLSCTGEQVGVANDWGVFKEIYCAGNDSVFDFLETVLVEVMDLFPSRYIHIGGDEAPKFRWEHCDKCQARMLMEGLKDEHELQSYFIKRIERFVNQSGRQLIGWDEILEGGLSPNATVQSWRGMEGGISAVKSGHKAIMSPTSHAYFDYDLKAIDLEKVYHFDPVPDGLTIGERQLILGGECNMWTERVPDDSILDAKVFPRLLAMSEVLWSYPQNKDYNAFYERVQEHYPLLSNLGVRYGQETLPVTIDAEIIDKKVKVKLTPGHPDLELKYCWGNVNDSYFPFSKVYTESFSLDTSGLLVVQAFKNSVEYGRWMTQPFVFHRALASEVNYNSEYNHWYTAGGDSALVDGKLGTLDFRDGNWQGFWGDDIDVIVDLGKPIDVSSISTNFFQYNNSWIFMPDQVTFGVSNDGVKFDYSKIPADGIDHKERGAIIKNYKMSIEAQTIRYIRVKAKNIKTVPEWHEAAGAEAWLFIDEIVVE